MNIKYSCTYWGCEKDEPNTFVDKVLAGGYDGVEIYLPTQSVFTEQFIAKLENIVLHKPGFIFIALQLSAPVNETVDSYISRMEKELLQLAAYQPKFINSHTGKDYYSFDDNCKVIEAALNISSKTGIRILHETHRGRFSFHASTLLPYLEKFPELELVGDLSHFCTVSESLLDDQENILQQIIPHISHIHARVGTEQSSQIANPFAPEWNMHLNKFTGWWQKIIEVQADKGLLDFTITPEAGPIPYMPTMPFTQQPLASQWDINVQMKNYLKEKLG